VPTLASRVVNAASPVSVVSASVFFAPDQFACQAWQECRHRRIGRHPRGNGRGGRRRRRGGAAEEAAAGRGEREDQQNREEDPSVGHRSILPDSYRGRVPCRCDGVRAPEFRGRGRLNTGGATIRTADLRVLAG